MMDIQPSPSSSAPHVQRRRVIRSAVPLLASLWCIGCVFFDNKYDECFGDPDCSATEPAESSGDGDGEDDSGGDSGTGSGSGDGDGGSKSSGGEDSGDGGERASGGREGLAAGGSSGAGSGGDETGGSGGAPAGGSGGDDGSGGDGSPGAGGATLDRLVINELRYGSSGFVEIYNGTKQTVDLTNLTLSHGTAEPNWVDLCSLSSAGTLSAGGHLEVTSSSSCVGVDGCITNCVWSVDADNTVYLLSSSPSVIVDERLFPDNISLTIGTSYAAYPDGSIDFEIRSQTAGEPNSAN